MWPKICVRLGGITGLVAGFVTGSLRAAPCCSNPPHPALPVATVVLGGLVAAVVTMIFAVVYTMLVTHRSLSQLFTAALAITVLVAVLVSEPAYLLGNRPWLAALFGGILGAILGFIACWVLCGRRSAGIPPTRGVTGGAGSGAGIGQCVDLLQRHGYQVIPPSAERTSP
jgi:putative effector of murein hydrolase